MKYLAAALVLLASVASASAAEMPKELIGNWCLISPAKFKQCKGGEYTITKAGTDIESGEAVCTPLEVRKPAENTWIIKDRCKQTDSDEVTVSTTQYLKKGGFLYVTEK